MSMMEYETRELGWDEEITAESTFRLLEPGDYAFRIEKFDRARHDGSPKIPPCPKAIVQFAILDENGVKLTTQTENFFLHTTMEWKLSELFASVGLKGKGEKVQMRWSELPGKEGVCKIKVRQYRKQDGTSGESNQIEKLYPAYAAPAIGNAATGQWQPPQNAPWNQGGF